MFTKRWARVAIVCAGVASGVFALTYFGREKPMSAAPVPAPTPKEKIADEAWIPKPGSDPGMPGLKGAVRVIDLPADPPSAFPDLVPPVWDGEVKNRDERIEKFQAAFAKMCPRLYGTIVLKIEANDDTLRKLLKARLHQATFEFRVIDLAQFAVSGPPRPGVDRYRDLLLDMQSAATELWAKQPKELAPWLEELVIVSKDLERSMRIRVFNGTISPSEYYAARRLRLKMEAELWKAKHTP